jgi:hypothetical protein
MLPDILVPSDHFSFLQRVAATFSPQRPAQLVLVMHLLDNAVPLVEALAKFYSIGRIIPIPYSAKSGVLSLLSQKYDVTQLSLQDLQTGVQLREIVTECILGGDLPLLLFDIGGYFSDHLAELTTLHPGRITGVIEETEGGTGATSGDGVLAVR